MNCVNAAVAVYLPFLGSLILIFAGWLVLSLLFSRPLSKTVKRLLLAGIPFLVLGVLVVIPLVLGLPLLLFWLYFLIKDVIRFFQTKAGEEREPLLPFSINASALLLSLVLIVVTSIFPQNTRQLLPHVFLPEKNRVQPHIAIANLAKLSR